MTKSGIKVGSRVKRKYSGEEDQIKTEYGIVIHLWTDPATGDADAYIAFFGDQLPKGKPDSKPYILRYFVSSLELVPE